jgi:gas vesicle protein
MAENDNTKAIVTAFVVGGVIGAALGILFAPKAGKETREDINEWMGETYEKGKEKMHKLGDEIKHRKEQLSQAFGKDKEKEAA